MAVRFHLFCAALLSLSMLAQSSPPVRLASGVMGSLKDLITEQQALAKKQKGATEGVPENPFVIGAPSMAPNATYLNKSKREAKSPGLIKRGIGFWGTYGGVTDIQAITALKDLAWWYTWASAPTSTAAYNLALQYGIEFVPMVWSPSIGTGGIPSTSKYLLGYNEPNVRPQANTDPWTAASNFDNFNRVANAYKLAKGTPSAVPCPGADYSVDCVLRAGWDWWDQYYASCAAQSKNCTVDFVATHLYSCSPTVLVSYIDSIWRRYKRPIWLTEFACCLAGSKASPDDILAQQIMYMRTAMSIMDNDPRIVRYAWFAPRVTGFACLGDSANLLYANGSLTTLGKVYTNSPIDLNTLPTAVKKAVTDTIPTVSLLGWDELCYVCDASSTFWGMQKLLQNAGNQTVYRSFINKCRLCGYEDEWNKTPL